MGISMHEASLVEEDYELYQPKFVAHAFCTKDNKLLGITTRKPDIELGRENQEGLNALS